MSLLLRRSTRGLFRRSGALLSSSSTSSIRFPNPNERSFASSVTQVGGQCTVLSSDFSLSPRVAANATTSLPKLQLSSAVLTQLQHHIATAGEQNAFYVVDTAAIEERFKLWNEFLPHVRPYYAVKCNPDPQLLASLARLGAGFDCASKAEINAVLAHGVPATDIIYANPCKQPSHIAHAAAHNVDLMTFDSTDELTKIQRINPTAKVVLRIYVDDTKAICRLGTKFGAMVHDIPTLLAHANDLNLDVVGVSFHVGSGCFSVSAYSDAVVRARKVFDIAERMGFQFSLLDIGGGFPGTETGPISFEDCAKELQVSLGEHFPSSSGIRIISEPGRFFAASTHTLAVNVIGRKMAPTYDVPGAGPESSSTAHANQTGPDYMYFVNDGLYGSFNCMVYDHGVVQPVVVSDEVSDADLHEASVWGPTCDGMDCIMKEVKMPVLEVGQWITFPSMGAYTCAAGSDFNGFEMPTKIYFDSSEQNQQPEQQFVH